MIEIVERAYNFYQTGEIRRRAWKKLSAALARSQASFLVVGSKRRWERFQAQTGHKLTERALLLPEQTSLARLLEVADSSRVQLAFLLNEDGRDSRLGVHTAGENCVLSILQPLHGILSGSVYRALSGHLPDGPGYTKSYIVASSRRTGSTLLCHLLEQTGVLGYPEEYISRKQRLLIESAQLDPETYLKDVFSWNTTANGVFGLKTHWQSFSRFQRDVFPRLSLEMKQLYRRLVEESQYVHLRRRDKIRQAVSDWRACVSGIYHLHHDDDGEVKDQLSNPLDYDYEEILRCLKVVLLEDEGWRGFFDSRGVEPLELYYEDLVEAPMRAVERIASSLSLRNPERTIRPLTIPLADEFTEVVYARFQEDLAKRYGSALLREVLPLHIAQPGPTRVPANSTEHRKRSVLVTLATSDYLDRAKAFFSSAFHNGSWDGDYLLLAHEVEESETLDWFRKKGILVRPVASLYSDKVGGMHQSLTSKYHLFTPYFRRWDTVVYSDLDAIVRASLRELQGIRGFAAVDDWSPSLHEQMVDEDDVRSRGLDKEEIRCLKSLAAEHYRLADRPFCAGFFAFSTDVIQDNTREELMALTDRFGPVSKFGDQLALNFHFYGRWQKLNPTFNVLVRQKSVGGFLEDLNEVETRWGKVAKLNPYILHIFEPKPWSAESGFHLEWLSFRHRACDIDLENIPPPSSEKLQAVKNTESQIRFRQRVYDLLEGLGEMKLPVIRAIHFWHWRLVVAGRFTRAVIERLVRIASQKS